MSSTVHRPAELVQARAVLRETRDALTAVEVQLSPLLAQFEQFQDKWVLDLIMGRGYAMANWDTMTYAEEQVELCQAAIAKRRAAFDQALAKVREIFTALAGPLLPQLLALNEQAPGLYQEAMRTRNWAPYLALQSTFRAMYQKIVSGSV